MNSVEHVGRTQSVVGANSNGVNSKKGESSSIPAMNYGAQYAETDQDSWQPCECQPPGTIILKDTEKLGFFLIHTRFPVEDCPFSLSLNDQITH